MKLRFDNCPNCFAKLDGRLTCSNCGIDIQTIKQYDVALEAFTLLHDKYLLGRVLGKGGFGITYLAQNIESGTLCCIKEYLPSDYAQRKEDKYTLEPMESEYCEVYEHGKERFIDEARTLVKLNNNPIVVDILDFFEENNTAYFVMEYLNGVSMKSLTKSYDGKLPKEIANRILEVIGTALMDVHDKGMLHRDISPENIFITNNKEIKLIDFGAARDYIKSMNSGMSVVLKTGYAPPEQYSTKGKQGPWTDIYALAATYYTSVSGEKLLDSMYVLKGMKQKELAELNCGIDQKTSDVIAKAMATNFRERYQNIADLLRDLNTSLDIKNNIIQGDVKNIEPNVPSAIGNHTSDTRMQSTGEQHDISRMQMENQQNVDSGGGQNRQIQQNQGEYPNPQYNRNTVNNQMGIIEILGNTIGPRRILVRDGRELKIGRSNKNCDFVISKDTVISRVHFTVSFDRNAGKFVVTDTSGNGTYFDNGARFVRGERTYVDVGTIIYLANRNYTLRFWLQ